MGRAASDSCGSTTAASPARDPCMSKPFVAGKSGDWHGWKEGKSVAVGDTSTNLGSKVVGG